jgi:hypothetical protein
VRIHRIDLRLSDSDGLWAMLEGHESPIPSLDVDAFPVAEDPEETCARRECTKLGAYGVEVYVANSRGASETIGLCANDLTAHRSGESFYIRIVRPR